MQRTYVRIGERRTDFRREKRKKRLTNKSFDPFQRTLFCAETVRIVLFMRKNSKRSVFIGILSPHMCPVMYVSGTRAGQM